MGGVGADRWYSRPLQIDEQAINTATGALKLLTILSRPTVKAAGRLQKRLVIEEGGHDREQVMYLAAMH